jgi:processive 1,2-diacylglycerol beta-glucosyltransferase
MPPRVYFAALKYPLNFPAFCQRQSSLTSLKKILILTVSYGEGHNSAARGVRDGLSRVAPASQVEVHDLFAETYGWFNELIRKAYLAIINWQPAAWGPVYRWLDAKASYDKDFARFTPLKKRFRDLLSRFQPDIVVSVFPAYPYLLQQTLAANRTCKSIVVITDSITVNRIWYRCTADYFLAPNPHSAAVVQAGGVAPEIIKTFGFPVSPKFAQFQPERPLPSAECRPRVLYMINAGTRRAPEQLQRLLALNVKLTVTVGRDKKLQRTIESVAGTEDVNILGWTDELPRLLNENHLLIGKAGGATVQEAIAARCPMIINHIVSGQEEGNAQLIRETNSGTIARSPREVAAQIEQAFADDARQWREWQTNISRLSRPRAALDVAEFLMSL